MIPADLREMIDARKAQFPARFEDAPGEYRELRDQRGQWTEHGLKRPEEWRQAVEQPKPYSDAPPKRDIPPVPRVYSKPLPKAKPVKVAAVPRAKAAYVANGRGSGWKRNEGLTIEAVLDGWAAGLSPAEIAAKHGCQRSTVNKRLVVARCDADFRKLEAKLRTCACGRGKLHYRKHCSVCAARNCDAVVTHRPDITIETILPMLRERLNLRQIADRHGCERRLIERRVIGARQHPEYGPILRAMATCAECGKSKYMHVPGVHCRRCAVKLGTVEARP